ncbi:hypothetical protein ACJJTC_005326 [Scirpophaga incertulas]
MGEKDINNEKQEIQDCEVKGYGLGVRHLQIACMTLNLTCLIISRATMGVAVLAMSDTTRRNSTDVEIFDWDKKTQSLILSSFFWGYLVMQIPAGIVAKRFGGKPILLFALASNMVICLLVPTFASWGGWMLVCACRATMGLTQACLFSATHTLLGQWLPANERTSYTGIVYGGMQIGTITAMPLSGILAETAMGWKSIFYAVSGILLANLLIWYCLGASSPKEHRLISPAEKKYIEAGLNLSNEQKRPPTPWKEILRSKPMWAILAPHIGFAISFVLFFVDMPTYLEKGLQISLKNSALLSALPYVGMWVGGMLSTFIAEKINNKGILKLTTSRKVVQSISSFGIAFGLILLSFMGPENKAYAVAALIFCLTMAGVSSAGFLVNPLDLSPNYAGVMFALLNFIANFVIVGMPIATSYILQNDPSNISRWKLLFMMMSGICVITNVIYVMFGISERQPWDDPAFRKKSDEDVEELRPVLKDGNKDKIEKV